MKQICLSLIALAAISIPASADERILHTALPSWCGGVQSSGACIRGAKDYVLVDGRVVWIDKTNPNDKRFWQIQDADKFGTDTGSAGQGASASGK